MQTENPFINILPPLYEVTEFAQRVNHHPAISKSAREIDKHIELDDLYNYYDTQVRSYDYYVHLSTLIYGGYKRRTPSSLIELIKKSTELTPDTIRNQINSHTSILNSTPNTLFIGYPGVGKTAVNNRIRSLFVPQYIHRSLGITQVPILKIECPPRASTLQLCRNFLAALDKAIESNYAYQYRNNSEPELMRQMMNKSVIHFIGVLLIDEIHNLKVGTETEITTTLNFLKFLTNEFKVPVVFIGTPQAEDLFKKDLQNASRIQTIKWNRILKDTPDWELMITKLWEYQIFEHGDLTQELKDTYYRLTQGIYRLVILLHVTAQRLALTNQWNRITSEVLTYAYQDDMYLTTIMLLALEDKNLDILAAFPDMRGESLAEKPAKPKSKQNSQRDNLRQVATIYKSFDSATIDELVDRILTEHPDETLETQAKELQRLVNSLPDRSPTKPDKSNPKGVLLDLTQNTTTSLDTYNILREAEIIKPILSQVNL